MPRGPKIVTAEGREAKLYLGKALQYLEACRMASAAGASDAVMLNAVHAAISGTDAVTIALARRRSADPDHQRAADLLQQVAGDSPELKGHVRQLRALLQRKNAAEYGARPATAREAADALRRADRFVDWAETVVARAKL